MYFLLRWYCFFYVSSWPVKIISTYVLLNFLTVNRWSRTRHHHGVLSSQCDSFFHEPHTTPHRQHHRWTHRHAHGTCISTYVRFTYVLRVELRSPKFTLSHPTSSSSLVLSFVQYCLTPSLTPLWSCLSVLSHISSYFLPLFSDFLLLTS